MSEMNLVDKAKELRKKSARIEITKAHYELMKAWVREEITLKQYKHALGIAKDDGRALTYIATILKESWHNKYFDFLEGKE